jgi:hypothetical protein
MGTEMVDVEGQPQPRQALEKQHRTLRGATMSRHRMVDVGGSLGRGRLE